MGRSASSYGPRDPPYAPGHVLRRRSAGRPPAPRLPPAVRDPADLAGGGRRVPGRAGQPLLLLAGAADLRGQRRRGVRDAAAALLAGRTVRRCAARPVAPPQHPGRREPAADGHGSRCRRAQRGRRDRRTAVCRGARVPVGEQVLPRGAVSGAAARGDAQRAGDGQLGVDHHRHDRRAHRRCHRLRAEEGVRRGQHCRRRGDRRRGARLRAGGGDRGADGSRPARPRPGQ